MLLCILIILIGIGIDQLSKLYAVKVLATLTTMPIIPNVFHLTYIENDGAAFSIFSGKQTFLIIITIIAIVIIGIILFAIPKKKKYFLTNFAFSLILSGAIGNLIDRIRFNYVVDFFDFRLIGFAIFNIADCFVVIGCFLLILAIWRNHFPQSRSELNLKKH